MGAKEEEKCRRCGTPLPEGTGRYVMITIFIADVNFQMEQPEENVEASMARIFMEIETTPEEELLNQVYQKQVFLICRPCKEKLAADPFAAAPPQWSDSTQ